MDEKKQNKTGIMILLEMVAAMGFLAATEGWLRVSAFSSLRNTSSRTMYLIC